MTVLRGFVGDVIGVDGCAGGWIAAFRDPRGAIHCIRVNALAELFENSDVQVMAVDVPIGLLERGARECDVEARRLLRGRRSSVFPAPIRPILAATSQADASPIRRSIEGKGVSIQTWGIIPKIMEVDSFLRADDGRCTIVREVHPEVSFFYLNEERPMMAAKKRAEGQAERLAVLRNWAGDTLVGALSLRRELGCKADDIVDAVVALWTAERIAEGAAISIPANPPLDAFGLRMEIVA